MKVIIIYRQDISSLKVEISARKVLSFFILWFAVSTHLIENFIPLSLFVLSGHYEYIFTQVLIIYAFEMF